MTRKFRSPRHLRAAPLAGLAALALAGALPAADAPPQSTNADPVASKHWGMLSTYCEKCHNSTDWAGGVAFDTLAPVGIADDAKTWEAAVSKLRGRMMPPPGEKQPDQATVSSFVSWMESSLDHSAAAHPQAGYVSLHRLNRTEYARAVKELLDVDVDPVQLLPKDTSSDGFDNIASVLKVSPTFLDQYVSAARSVAAEAVGNAHAAPAIVTYRGGAREQSFHIDGLPLGTRGGLRVVHNFPADGMYTFNLNVNSGFGNPGLAHRAIFLIDGRQVLERTIGGPEDLKKSDQLQQEASKEFAARFRGIKLPMTAGPHELIVTFQQRAMSESDDWLGSFNPESGTGGLPVAGGVEIRGPENVTGVADSPSRRRIFICRPADPSQEQACATRILTALATSAFRRPVTDADLEAPLRFFESGRKDKDFDAGVQNAIVAILASPKFLYRAEEVPQSVTQAVAQAADVKVSLEQGQQDRQLPAWHISDLELASRLSFFLWSEGPDPQLLQVAGANRLHDPQVLRDQVRRMLADPRANALVTNFAFQWLQVDGMDKILADQNVYPNFDEDVRTAFRKEMELWVGSILLQDVPVTELLTSNWTYLNERLALLYGIRNVKGDTFRRVELTPAESPRYGLLGKGAVLMGTSYPTRTAPVLRGEWVLASITGTPPDAPPPGVPSLKDNETGKKALTLREMMAKHRDRPSCFACHGILDPLGLALENFDAVGVWRDKDRMAGTEIDASGVLPDGTKISGVDDLRKALASDPNQFVQTLTQKLMTYGIGRIMDYQDMPTIRAIVRESEKQGYRFEPLIMDIVTSAPFQLRTASADAAPVKTAALIR